MGAMRQALLMREDPFHEHVPQTGVLRPIKAVLYRRAGGEEPVLPAAWTSR